MSEGKLENKYRGFWVKENMEDKRNRSKEKNLTQIFRLDVKSSALKWLFTRIWRINWRLSIPNRTFLSFIVQFRATINDSKSYEICREKKPELTCFLHEKKFYLSKNFLADIGTESVFLLWLFLETLFISPKLPIISMKSVGEENFILKFCLICYSFLR